MKEGFKELFPPSDDGQPLAPLTRWRIAVFIAISCLIMFATWAVSPYGFALAEDVRSVRNNVDDMRLTQIEQQVYDAKQSECLATDAVAERFFANRVTQLAREYRNLARAEMRIPPCARGSSSNE